MKNFYHLLTKVAKGFAGLQVLPLCLMLMLAGKQATAQTSSLSICMTPGNVVQGSSNAYPITPCSEQVLVTLDYAGFANQPIYFKCPNYVSIVDDNLFHISNPSQSPVIWETNSGYSGSGELSFYIIIQCSPDVLTNGSLVFSAYFIGNSTQTYATSNTGCSNIIMANNEIAFGIGADNIIHIIAAPSNPPQAQIGQTISRQYQITNQGGLNHFTLQYTPETDIAVSELMLTQNGIGISVIGALNSGVINITPEMLQSNGFNIHQPYIISETATGVCMQNANTGTLNIQVNCTNGCPSISASLSNVNVNILQPAANPVTPSYTSNTPLYCNTDDKEITLTLNVNSPQNNIQLITLAIPFNDEIYDIEDVELNNESLSGIYTFAGQSIFIDFSLIDPAAYGLSNQISGNINNTSLPEPYVYLQNGGLFILKIKYSFNCSTNTVIKSCHFTNSIIPKNPLLVYRNICRLINNTNAFEWELPVVANGVSSNSTHTIIPNDVDYGALPAGGLSVNTEFNFTPSGFSTNNTPFTLGNSPILHNCTTVSYSIRLSIPQNYELLSYIVQVGNPLVQNQFINAPTPAANNIYDIPLNQILNNQPVRLFVQMNIPGNVTCPFGANVTFGTLPTLAELVAACNPATCTDCYRVFACETAELNVHCPGDCDGVAIATNSFNIERVTFGWNEKNDFLNNDAPITRNDLEAHYDLNNPQEAIAFHNQLHSVYQEDRIQVISNGYLIAGQFNSISFEVAYPARNTTGQLFTTSGGAIFDYITPVNNLCKFIFINPANNDEVEHTISSVTSTGTVEINGTGFKTIVLTFSNSADINNLIQGGFTNLRFEGIFTINKHGNTLAQTYTMPSVRGQFLCSPSNPSLSTFSCDPYFSNLNMYILSHEVLSSSGFPGLPLLQNGLSSYNGNNNFNQLWNDGSPHRLLLSPCIGRRSFAFRVYGGLGPTVDEFPHEYRPYFFIPNNTTQAANGIAPNSVTYNTELYELTAPTPINLLHLNNWWEVSLNTPISNINNSETRHLEFNNNQRAYEKGEAIITTSNSTYEEVLDFILPLRKLCTTANENFVINLTIEHTAYARANGINNFTQNHSVDLSSGPAGIQTSANISFTPLPYSPPPTLQAINLLSSLNGNTNNIPNPLEINTFNNTLTIPFELSQVTTLENAWFCVTAPNGVQIGIISQNPTVPPTPTVNANGILYFGTGLQGTFNGNLHITVPCSLLNTANPVNGMLASLNIELRYGNICRLPAGFNINNLTCNDLTTLNNCTGVGLRNIQINIMQPVVSLEVSSAINSQNNCSHLQLTATVTNPQTAPFGSAISGQLHVSLPNGLGLNTSTSTITNNGTGVTFSVTPSIFNAGSNSYSGYALPENGLTIAPGNNAIYELVIAIPCSTNVTALLNSIFIGTSTCTNLVTSDLLSAIQTFIQNNNACCSNLSNAITYLVLGSCLGGAQGNGTINLTIGQTSPATAYSFILTNQTNNQPQAMASNITGTSHSFTNLPQGTYLLTVSDGTSTMQFENIEVGASAQSCAVDAQFLNQSAASVTLLGYSQFDNTSGVIGLNGSFTIDADFTFDNAHIIMGPGAAIDILPGKTLTVINNTYIHGCCQMWDNIIVQSGASLYIEDFIIEDADMAINVQHQANLYCVGSSFIKNRYGIYLDNTFGSGNEPASLHIADNNFLCANGNTWIYLLGTQDEIAYAGIYIDNHTYTDLEAANNFHGLKYGIYALNSDVFVGPKNTFRKIRNNINPNSDGVAVYVESNDGSLHKLSVHGGFNGTNNPLFGQGIINMKNCKHGVEAKFMHVNIVNLVADGVNRGVYVHGSQMANTRVSRSFLLNCSISGIETSLIDPVNILDISANTITINNSTLATNSDLQPTGIRLFGTNNFPNESASITENYITLYAAKHGMVLNSTSGYKVHQNHIYLQNPVYNANGINSLGNSKLEIRCNYVDGIDAANSNANAVNMNPNTFAAASNNIINCNTLINTRHGIKFIGNSSCVVRGNEFDNNRRGLYYESSANVGLQLLRGNKWSSSFGVGTWGAWADVSDMPFLNVNNRYDITSYYDEFSPKRIRVGGTASGNQSFLASNFSIENQFWFVVPIGVTSSDNFNCGVSDCLAPEYIQAPHDSISRQKMQNALESDSLHAVHYSQYQNWDYHISLLRSIENNPTLLENSLINEWYNQMQNSSAVQYKNASSAMIGLYTLSSADSDFVSANRLQQMNNDSLIQEINYLLADSILSENDRAQLLSQKRNLIANNIVLRNSYNNWLANYRKLNTRPDSTLWLTHQLADTAFYEYNQKTIQKIYLSTVARGIFNLDSVQAFFVHAIASQCPNTAGSAVYLARSLYRLINDTLDFNDESVCIMGMRHEEANGVDFESLNFNLYPNPNDGNFILQWEADSKMNLVLNIYDVLGKKLYSQNLNNYNGRYGFKHHLNNGVYLLQVLNAANEQIFTSRVTVNK